MKSEKEAEHEHNILDMTQVEDYKSPYKDKYSTTVNDTAYTFLNSFNDDISGSIEQVETSKEPIKDTQTIKEPITYDTHLVDIVCYLQDGPTNMDTVVTRVGIV